MVGCTILLACPVGDASARPLALTLRIPSSWETRAPRFQDLRHDWNGNLKFRCCVLAAEGVVLESEPRAPRPFTSPWGYFVPRKQDPDPAVLGPGRRHPKSASVRASPHSLASEINRRGVGWEFFIQGGNAPEEMCRAVSGCSNYKAERLSSRGHWTDLHKELFCPRCPLFLC